MPLKFLHAAGTHLDSPLRGLERCEDAPVELIRGATRRAFENQVAPVTADLTLDYPAAHPGLFNIGLLHTSLDGRPGRELCPLHPGRPALPGLSVWAQGHVHQHEVVACDPWGVFPGTTQGRRARETGPKGCCLVEVDDGQVQRVENNSSLAPYLMAPYLLLIVC